jgi:hypothetical protein
MKAYRGNGEHYHGGESNRWAKVQAFFYAHLHVIVTIFPHKSLVDYLALRNEFEANKALGMEQSGQHYLDL